MKRASVAAALGFALAPCVAFAHSVGLSAGQYRWTGGGKVAVELTFARPEAAAYLAAMKNEADAELDEGRAARFGQLLVEGVVLRADGAPCKGAFEEARLVEGDGVSVRARYTCAASAKLLEVELAFLEDFVPGHRHAGQGLGGGSPVEAFAHRGAKKFTIPIVAPVETPGGGAGTAFVNGLTAMFSSPLHGATLFGLLLAGADALAAFGAFALGCALALIGARLGGAIPSGKLLMPLSAVGAAWVLVESFLAYGQPDLVRGRWRYAAFLGLLPGLHLLRAFEGGSSELMAFAGGVLASQVAIGGAAIALTRLLGRRA